MSNLGVRTALENKTHKGGHFPEQSEMHEEQTFTSAGAGLSLYRDKWRIRPSPWLTSISFKLCWCSWPLLLFFSLELKLAVFQQRVNRESLKLWNKFPKSPVQPCLPHRTNFLLPQQSVNRRRSQSGQSLAILHEMLLQTFNLFRAGISLDGWEEIRVENFPHWTSVNSWNTYGPSEAWEQSRTAVSWVVGTLGCRLKSTSGGSTITWKTRSTAAAPGPLFE